MYPSVAPCGKRPGWSFLLYKCVGGPPGEKKNPLWGGITKKRGGECIYTPFKERNEIDAPKPRPFINYKGKRRELKKNEGASFFPPRLEDPPSSGGTQGGGARDPIL